MSRRCAMALGGRWAFRMWKKDGQDSMIYSDMAAYCFGCMVQHSMEFWTWIYSPHSSSRISSIESAEGSTCFGVSAVVAYAASTSNCQLPCMSAHMRPSPGRHLHPVLSLELIPCLVQRAKHRPSNHPYLGAGVLGKLMTWPVSLTRHHTSSQDNIPYQGASSQWPSCN